MEKQRQPDWKLITTVLSGDADANERNAFNKWLAEDKNNSKLYAELKQIWEKTGNIQHYKNLDLKSAWDKMLSKQPELSGTHKKAFSKQLKNKIRPLLRIAAIFLIGFFVAWFANKLIPGEQAENYHKIVVPRGQKSEVILADGTQIWLNSESKLSYPANFTGKNREVHLSGEAFFKVTHNSENPFIVKTSDINIQVHGTSFNVKSYPKDGIVETTLIDGSISIMRQNSKRRHRNTIQLKPNQKAVYIKGQGKIKLSDLRELHKNAKDKKQKLSRKKIIVSDKADTEKITAWKDKKLIFRNEKFDELANRLERWYDVEITITNPELTQYHYSGTIENETIHDVLEIIKLTLPIKYTIKHKNIHIEKKTTN